MSDLSKVQSHSHCSLVNNKLSLLTDLFSLISIGPETGAGARDDRKLDLQLAGSSPNLTYTKLSARDAIMIP